MKQVTSVAAAVAASCLLVGCFSTSPSPDPAGTVHGAPAASISSVPPPDPVRERVPQDQRAKVASLLVVGVANFDDALAKLQQGAGGIFIPSWADAELLTAQGRDITELRRVIGRPFSVSIDFEGGRVQRHEEVLGSHSSPRELASTMSVEQVEEHAHRLGESLRRHGITVDFAPVIDVDTAALDVVGDRAFSTDPTRAGEYGAAFARGLQAAGITPVFKHFPGHGQASGDTHYELAVTPPLDQLKAHDLVPYTIALREKRAAVMVGHMVVPGLGEALPASLNPAAYQLLRSGEYPNGIPFTGLIYTDDLAGMRAITDKHPLPLAVSMAIAAGADQALFSSVSDFNDVISSVEAAVNTGQIPQQQIDDSAYRVQRQLLDSGL
ncbi:glycoside hydrolase family 3 N-terminal domain-containing protein [Corynebacterium atrinae]|uniref:glycoside hydrolase family 3 N-terminal domain-containing protein n=1 Tax=Corynebacterium atrinae TaxID=1336740 RepID=UPI0025B4DC3B|nr:glycoside hydrolase family 3 N-terminal domain-containing protein [Corynebacterium atrinae]